MATKKTVLDVHNVVSAVELQEILGIQLDASIDTSVIMIHDVTFREDQLKNLSDAQIAWQLYRLDRGISYYSPVNFSNGFWKGTWNTFKLPFKSLEELDLKLAIRGY